MSDLGLFLVGFLITIPAGAGIVALMWAAVADGRENDRVQVQVAADRDAVAPTPRTSPT